MAEPFRCGRRVKTCAKCKRRYTVQEHELWACPACGKDRHCTTLVGRKGAACRMHGGASLKGIASPLWRGRGYSKYLPSGMLADHKAFASEEAYLELRNEIDLTRTLLADRLRALAAIDNSDAWAKMRSTYDAMMEASKARHHQVFARLAVELGTVIAQGAGASKVREEVMALIDEQRKLVDTSSKEQERLGEFITRGVAMAMFSRFLEVVKDHVTKLPGGHAALRGIADALAPLSEEVDGGELPSGG